MTVAQTYNLPVSAIGGLALSKSNSISFVTSSWFPSASVNERFITAEPKLPSAQLYGLSAYEATCQKKEKVLLEC